MGSTYSQPLTAEPAMSHGRQNWFRFACLLALQIWLAHAIAFFAHEYAHSVTAWLLGWKSDPFALHFPKLSPIVLLIQSGINQNVDETAILASGHRYAAALISAAGALFGNALISLPLSRIGYKFAVRKNARGWAMLCYWVTVASVGNLIDYVPVRTFTDGTDLYQDTYAVELGLHWSPWLLLVVFGIPTALVLARFLFHTEPETIAWLYPSETGRRVTMALLTAFLLFVFYGAAGWAEGGPISHKLSVISVCLVAPVAAVMSSIWVAKFRTSVRRVA